MLVLLCKLVSQKVQENHFFIIQFPPPQKVVKNKLKIPTPKLQFKATYKNKRDSMVVYLLLYLCIEHFIK